MRNCAEAAFIFDTNVFFKEKYYAGRTRKGNTWLLIIRYMERG